MRQQRDKDEEFKALFIPRIERLRKILKRVVLLLNGKGGTGKTSTVANMGGELAHMLEDANSDKRILLLEFDKQGNLTAELGQKGKPGDDEGQSYVDAIRGVGGLNVVRDVRPHLDLVPGGKHMATLTRVLAKCEKDERIEHWVRFMEALAEIAGDYEWILIDCPPTDEESQLLAVATGEYMIVSSTFDMHSRHGLELVGDLFATVGWVNRVIDVIGVVLFAFERRDVRVVKDKETKEVVRYVEQGQRARVRRVLNYDLEQSNSEATVFETVISNSRVTGEVCSGAGLLVSELADIMKEPQRWEALRKQLSHIKSLGGMVTLKAETVEGLAADYQNVTVEAFKRALELEAAE